MHDKPPSEDRWRKKAKAYRRIIIGLLGGKCDRCGSTSALTVWFLVPPEQASLENLVVLCASCFKRARLPKHVKTREEALSYFASEKHAS